MLAARSQVRRYWQHQMTVDPLFVSSHPANQTPLCWDHTVPLDTYEDAAEYINDDEGLVFSISSPLAKGSSYLSRVVTCVIPVSWLVKNTTIHEIKRFQVWSFQQLLAGVYPDKGCYGESFFQRLPFREATSSTCRTVAWRLEWLQE